MKKMFALVLGLIITTQAAATDVTLLLGYQFNDDLEVAEASGLAESGDNLRLDGDVALGLAVDFVFQNNPDQRVGFYVTHHLAQLESRAALDDEGMEITHLHFTAMNYYPKGNWEPFVLAGIGAGYFSPADKSMKAVTKLSGQLATGANYKISDNFLLRLEARWIPTFFNGSSAAFCSGGCVIAVKSDMYSQFQANVGLMYRF